MRSKSVGLRLHHWVEGRLGWRLSYQNTTSAPKSAPCPSFKTFTAHGLYCQIHSSTNSEIKEWRSWYRSSFIRWANGGYRDSFAPGPLPALWQHQFLNCSLVGARSDFFLSKAPCPTQCHQVTRLFRWSVGLSGQVGTGTLGRLHSQNHGLLCQNGWIAFTHFLSAQEAHRPITAFRYGGFGPPTTLISLAG